MHRFRCWWTSFLSKLTTSCISNTAWLFGAFMHYRVMKQRKATPADRSRWDRFAYKLNSNELLYIFCINSAALRLMQAVWFPPSPCQRKNRSSNTKRSPSKALNEVVNLCQNHWRRPQRVLQGRLGRLDKKTLLSLIGWLSMHMWVLFPNQSSREM